MEPNFEYIIICTTTQFFVPNIPRHKQELAPGLFFRSLAPPGDGGWVRPDPLDPFFLPPGPPAWEGGGLAPPILLGMVPLGLKKKIHTQPHSTN